MPDLARLSVEDHVATITLDSPSNRNALSMPLIANLVRHLDAAACEPAVRAIVIAHTGQVFCAGADLKEQRAEGGPALGTVRMIAMMRAILDVPKPVIARIDGAVRAGGLGIVGACDLAFASRASSFAFTEVRLGVVPAVISLTTLSVMTARSASRYLLTGETFDAETAARIGLITDRTEDLDAELSTVLAALRRCAPHSLAEAKRLVTRRSLSAIDGRAESMRQFAARLYDTDEAREGIAAFLEKRQPWWAD